LHWQRVAAIFGTIAVPALNLILLLQAARMSPWPPFHAA
jgi:manganese transport protein